ncbi:hypothetical protein UA08_06739 [Talaromyces atroroseus]|uniref:Peptidase C14 caspase domain-containing protein n=1 Tax=Talaromyces atroroseus TaxID=1441469 RepID=A0A225AAN2_TALAT|nr:hypothetical protein UA08_06739 [Talaromyces atroroseus]OKL58041.1 hypothetical protein UA08_06739 [Talaromyces atroroseus]
MTSKPDPPSSLFDPSICPHCLRNTKLPRQGNGQALPVSIPNAHIDFADFKNRVNAALKSEAEQDHHYQEVKVLLLNWEDNDIGLKPSGTGSYILDETRQLMEMFKNTYHYDAKYYLIPSNDPQQELAQILVDNVTDLTRKHRAGKKVLFIVYYNGHGVYNKGKLIWSARGTIDSQSPALSWYDLQTQLEKARFDVLLVLDCCNAAGAITSESKEGAMEVLAACGRESIALGPDVGSISGSPFTHSLTRHLHEQASDPDGLLTSKLYYLLQLDPILDNQSPNYFPFDHHRGPIVLRPLLSDAETAQISKRQQDTRAGPVAKVLISVSFYGDVLPDAQKFVELFNAQRLRNYPT